MMFHRALILQTATDVALLEDSIKLSRYEVLTRLVIFVSHSLYARGTGLSNMTVKAGLSVYCVILLGTDTTRLP